MLAIYSTSYSFVCVNLNVVKNNIHWHIMLGIYPSYMNINMRKQRPISVNSNINVGNFYHDTVEYNSVKASI